MAETIEQNVVGLFAFFAIMFWFCVLLGDVRQKILKFAYRIGWAHTYPGQPKEMAHRDVAVDETIAGMKDIRQG